MTALATGVGVKRGAGTHLIDVVITSGTVTFSISLDDGSTYSPLTDGVISATSNFNVTIPECYIKAVMSATATATIDRIRYPK